MLVAGPAALRALGVQIKGFRVRFLLSHDMRLLVDP